MNQVIDPVTGMPIPTQQPVNVGMPGSKPIPANVAHNIQQPMQTGQRMLNPIAPMMRTDPPKKPVGAGKKEPVEKEVKEENIDFVLHQAAPSEKGITSYKTFLEE